jgi:hypothetical protein
MSISHTESSSVERARKAIHEALRAGTTPEALDPLLARYEEAVMARAGRAGICRSHGETGHECDALCMEESHGVPCGCPTNSAGGALCEQRSGFPGSYCLHERQFEERAREEAQSDEPESLQK